MFSIDGFSRRTFEKIRVGLKFKEVVKNCLNFIKLRDTGNYKTTIRVRMVLQDENISELGKFLNYWKQFLKEKIEIEHRRRLIKKDAKFLRQPEKKLKWLE